jgi:surface-anchored protein
MLLTATLDHFVTTEHTDLRSAYSTGEGWSLVIDEEIQGQLELGDTLVYVGTNAQANRPGSSDWAFTGVGAGQPFYFGGQVQEDGLLYLGASSYDVPGSLITTTNPFTESKGRFNGSAKWGKFSLVDVDHTNPDGTPGTGVFSAWSSGSFGQPTVLMSSYNDGVSNPNGQGLDRTDGISGDDAWWLVNGGHAHYNFGFSAPGRYEVQLQLSANFTSGGVISSAPLTVYFSVGSVGQVEFDASSYAVAEDGGSATINVRRVGGSDGQITVDYATANGTATAGTDYTATSGTLTFADGETMKQITIPILTDSQAEGDETVLFSLTAPGPETIVDFLDFYEDGILGALDTATLTITDVSPNSAPSISNIADQSVLEGNSTPSIGFTVGDTETAAADLVVTATSSNQTLVPDGNIVLGGSGANRTITITPAAGQFGPTTITVTVTDAGGLQASDTFVLTVGDLVRATFDRAAGIVNPNRPLDVHLADIDGDSDLDVLYSTHITSISFLLNNGDGTFGAPTALPAITVSEVQLADINGDNQPDIVSSVYIDNTYAETAIAVWRNLGSGNFADQEIIESTRSTNFVRLTGVGDVDGDGRNDLVLNFNSASYVRNLGGGAFGPVTNIITGGLTWSSASQDVDQDGDLDVVRAFDDDGVFRLHLFRNSGDSTPVFAGEEIATFGTNTIRNLAIGDTNQDGFIDIHLLKDASSGTEIIVLRGASTGAFLAPVTVGSAPVLHDLKIGDIDGDGRPDLASASRDQNQVLFAQNLGSGVFTDLQQFTSDGVYLNPGHEDVEIGDIDGDGRNDLVYMERFSDRIAWSRNRQQENITALTVPESRTYLNGYPMTFDVFLGFNVLLDTSGGSPTLPVTIGSQTIQVPFIGQPNANTLRFRYQVQSIDVDIDGIQVANSVVLNGATITDVHDRPIDSAFLQFAAVDTTGILVNGGAPYVAGIMRLDATPAITNSVRYAVTFSEPVTGVTLNDFTLDANGPTGAAITSVTGSGDSYVVTADIGSGDGTLKLRVLDDDSIVDANMHPLGGVGVGSGEFAYGQGYTIRSSTATPVFNNVITDGHLDVSLLLYEGDWYPYWNGVGFWDTTDTVISAGPDAQATRPVDAKWDFLGAAAGDPVWIFPETFSTTTPWPGVGAYDNSADTFASYFESDPRINATAPWLTMQLLDVRGPEGGQFSLYQSGITDPKVFMTTADGITSDDTAWIPNLDHIHYNWAFTKPGLYQVDVIASGYVDFNQTGTYEPGVDPLSESQIITLHFAVELSAQDDSFAVTGRETLRGSVTLNDQSEWGIAASTTTVETGTTKGTLLLQPNGSFTYQPSVAFDGSDSFTYRLTNPNGGFTTATVTISGSELPEFHAGLTQGHGDLGIAFEDGAWDLHVHVDGEEHEGEGGEEHEHGGLEYVPDQILIQVGTASATTVPNDPAFSFIGATGGSEIFLLPATQNPALPFLGLATEEITDGTFQNDEITLRLKSVSGPGFYSVWSTDGFGAPTPYLTSSNGIDGTDALILGTGGHFHFDMAFTAAGVYAVTLEATGVLEADGSTVSSGDLTYYFAVNTGAAPTITLPEAVTAYTEQAAARIVATSVSITDVDSINFDGGQLRVDIPVHAQTGDELLILHQGNGTNQIGVSGNTVTVGVPGGSTVVLGTFTGGTNGDPLVVSLSDQATPARVQALMRRIAFRNMTDNPTDEERGVRFVVADGDGEISDAVIREVAVTPVNDAPVVMTSVGSSSYTENDPAVVIDSGVNISDADSPDFAGGKLTVTIGAGRQLTDRLTISAQGDGPGEINVAGTNVLFEGVVIGTYTGGYTTSNPLVVTLNANATPSAVQQLARRVSFRNSGGNPTTLLRTISFVVSDGDGMTSLAATKSVAVTDTNNAPVIGNVTTPISYTEARPAVLVAGSAVLTDVDSANFAGGVLTFSLMSGGGSADVLAIRSQGIGSGRINLAGANVTYQLGAVVSVIGTWSGGGGVNPLVVALNSNATVAATTALIRNVTFQVIGSTPNSSRTMQITLSDGDGGTSTPVQRTINVIAVNDAPVVVTSVSSSSYTENDPAVVIDSGVNISDVDSPDFAGGKLTVTIGAGRQLTDRLTISAQGDGPGEINVAGTNVLYEGVVIGTYAGGYTSSSPLVVTLNANATPAAVQQLARRISFHNSGDNPTGLSRTVSFVVSDGDGKTSLTATKSVAVTAMNDGPVVSNLGAAVNYNQNAAPVLVAGAALVTDADSANFDGGSLTVSLVSGGIAADEVSIRSQGAGNGRINLAGANVTYGVGGVAVVIGTWSGGTGTNPLVVTLNSNATPVAVQALVRNITFRVIGSTLTSSRTIRFSLSDGDGGTSLDMEKQLNVLGINFS